MENPKNESNEKVSCWSKIKKLFQCIWNSGGSISKAPDSPPSAQEIRDEYLKKCPWREDGF